MPNSRKITKMKLILSFRIFCQSLNKDSSLANLESFNNINPNMEAIVESTKGGDSDQTIDDFEMR